MISSFHQSPLFVTIDNNTAGSPASTTVEDDLLLERTMQCSSSTSAQLPTLRLDTLDNNNKSNTNNDHGRFEAIEPRVPASVLLSCRNIPFARTFDLSESYRRNSEKDCGGGGGGGDSLLLTQQRLLPQRRRCRSSEGMILRIKGNEDLVDNDVSTIQKEPHSYISPLAFTFEQAPRFESELRRRKGKVSLSPEDSTGRSKRPNQHRRTHSNNLQQQRQERRWWIIPIEHRFKMFWDVLTVVLSVAHTYLTHLAIRDRKFGSSPFITFCDTCFLIDILLNFVTERRTQTGEILRDPRSICARYLISWFAVDALALFPWESLYVQPLIEMQNRRGFLQKYFFRSKAVVRVTKHLRGKHFRWFGTVAKHTKQHGVGAKRLLRLIIKYAPKYVMFLRNMKGIVAMRILRFVHWVRRSISSATSSQHVSLKSDASTRSMTTKDGDEMYTDDISSCPSSSAANNGDDPRNHRRVLSQEKPVEFIYESEDWGMFDDDYDDDDGGVPL
jgi:hypothetical protein